MTPEKKRLVSQRLKMVHRLIEFHDEKLASPEHIERVGQGWTHHYGQHDALVNYLLLTCFDVLGSRDEWMPFGEWLCRTRTAGEREDVLKTLPNDATPVQTAKHMFDGYNRLYGVRQSFFRFIDTLDDPVRKALLYSLNTYKNGELVEDEKLKKDCLYSLRNSFTHEAIAHGQMSKVIAGLLVILGETGDYMYGFYSLATTNKVDCRVRRWPFVLYEVVAGAIGEPVPPFKVKIQVNVSIEGFSGSIPVASKADLIDPDLFRAYVRTTFEKL